jgi:hypothetical protein
MPVFREAVAFCRSHSSSAVAHGSVMQAISNWQPWATAASGMQAVAPCFAKLQALDGFWQQALPAEAMLQHSQTAIAHVRWYTQTASG